MSKTRSLDNVIQEFSLAWPTWVINHYTMLYKVFLYIVAFCLLLQTKVDIYLSFFRHFSPNNHSPCACWTWDDNSQLGPYRPCWLFVISHAMCTHEIIFEIIIIIIIGFFIGLLELKASVILFVKMDGPLSLLQVCIAMEDFAKGVAFTKWFVWSVI